MNFKGNTDTQCIGTGIGSSRSTTIKVSQCGGAIDFKVFLSRTLLLFTAFQLRISRPVSAAVTCSLNRSQLKDYFLKACSKVAE